MAKKRNLKFDISRVCFSHRDSMLTLVEEFFVQENGIQEKQISLARGISHYGGVNPFQTNTVQMHLRPIWEGNSISFTSGATPSLLKLLGKHGDCRICFDGPNALRIQSHRMNLRIVLTLKEYETVVHCKNGSIRVNFTDGGQEFLIAPMNIYGRAYILKNIHTESEINYMIDLDTDTENDAEFLILSGKMGIRPLKNLRTFEECVRDVQQDWEQWSDMYPEVSNDYSYIRDLATYCVWQSCVANQGIIKEPFVFFMKMRSCGGLCWQQTYHALSIHKDIDIAVHLLAGVFQFQDEYGMLPDSVNDVHAQYSVTKPPFQGYVLLKMMEFWQDSFTKKHAEIIYPGLCRWMNWWLEFRDSDHDGNPQFNNGCETGVDKNEALSGGVPAETPDLMSYCILMEEVLSRLAAMLGKDEESSVWKEKSEHLLHELITEFWNGKSFIARVSGSHQVVEYEELEGYLPLMLGKRLPEEITKPLIARLKDPEIYFTPYGFRTYPKKYIGSRQIPGFIGMFAQFKLFPALLELGERDVVKVALKGFLDQNTQTYPNFGIMEFDDPEFNRKGAATTNPGTHMTSLGAAIYIYLAWLWDEAFGKGDGHSE